MKLVVALIPIVSLLGLPQAGLASTSDRGFMACRIELRNSGKAVSHEEWSVDPLNPIIYNAIKNRIPTDGRVVRSLSHVNPNRTKTIVVEISVTYEDLDYWVVVFQDNRTTIEKEEISAVGAGFSRSSSVGVSGLYFCTKQGISHEWTWNGSSWQ